MGDRDRHISTAGQHLPVPVGRAEPKAATTRIMHLQMDGEGLVHRGSVDRAPR